MAEPVRTPMLPRAATATIAVAFLAGLTTLGGSLGALSSDGLARNSRATLLLLVALVVASWVWPLVMYHGSESEAVHLDEGFLVIMVVALSGSAVVVGFAAAMVVAQLVRRRPLVKSLFNFGQVLTAVGLSSLAFHTLAGNYSVASPRVLAAATVAAIVFFAVNNLALAAILRATGAPLRGALVDGIEIRFLLVAASVALGLLGAIAISAYSWALVVSIVPMLILRQVLAGHFRARHDRTRLLGLLDATL
ncbi:MAG TPA: hypothetical protein VGZ52_08980, partial [Acidimicrobiales bacterium]|nr:hypothetical protein [Acidimicrobiales bacterium]